ncbi:MAG: hypothetical protein RIC55_14665 [Pirellulaceae bacterium]
MSPTMDTSVAPFVDRRNYGDSSDVSVERRQFTNSHSELSPDARELAQAIDEYKLRHRRRFITYEEMLNVIRTLGYSK